MKLICLILCFLLIVGTALGASSPTNQTIAQAKIVNVTPIDASKEIVIPIMKIIEDTEDIIKLREDMMPKHTVILFDYEIPLSIGIYSNNNLGICME